MKVIILGIDGGTWDILGPACDKGLMPNLNRFRTEGAWGVLHSTHPPITPPAWTTLMTGMNPGHHGVLGFFEYDLNKNATTNVNSSNIKNETLWQKLARHGKKVVVVGVPMTYPPLEVDGILVSGFETPSIDSQFTYPASFQKEILKEIPDLQFSPPFTRKQKKQVKTFGKYLDWLRENSHHMLKIYKMGIAKVPWTVSMIMLKSFDELVHHFCKILDFSWDTGSDPRTTVISRYFKELDEIIGEILTIAKDNQATVLAVSDHGGEVKQATIYVNKILTELGYLKLVNQRSLLCRKFHRRLKKLNPFSKSSHHRNPDDRMKSIDIASSRALVAGIGVYANLYLLGKLQSDGQRSEQPTEELLKELRIKMLNIMAPDGKKLFRMITTPTEIYGPDIKHGNLPDLMIAPREGYSMNARINNPKTIDFARKGSLSGDHSFNGMFGALGPTIEAKKEITANIADITPTVLAMLNLPVTRDMDGKTVENAFKSPLQVDYENPVDSGTAQPYSYSDAEKAEINSRLENLGYL